MGQNTESRNRLILMRLIILTKEPKKFKSKGITFQQMVLEQLASHMKTKRNKNLGFSISFHTQKSILCGRRSVNKCLRTSKYSL